MMGLAASAPTGAVILGRRLSSTFRIFPGRFPRGDISRGDFQPEHTNFSVGRSFSRSLRYQDMDEFENESAHPLDRMTGFHLFHRGQSSGNDSSGLSRRMRKGEPRWRMRLANILEARSDFQGSSCAPSMLQQDRRSGSHVRGWSVLMPSQAVHTEDAEDHGAPRRPVTSDCRCLLIQAG